ncbi:MAG: 3-methyl-2-oxobutanoate hydroxymethyltransferase [bacterium]
MSREKMTAPKIANKKRLNEKIVCITAYDCPMGRIADAAGVDLILVGDSVGNVVLGYENTLPVTMEEMLHHTRAVRRGVKNALLVADMPFMSYQASEDEAIRNAGLFIKAGAEAVKVEGGISVAPLIKRLTDIGIPVMGHVGMTPQSINKFGGYRVQGRGTQSDIIAADAKAVQEARAFCVVLELIPAVVSERITRELKIPTIGIGAGPDCDGEIQVINDLLGLSGETLKHTKCYVDAGDLFAKALETYSREVRERQFPTEENTF